MKKFFPLLIAVIFLSGCNQTDEGYVHDKKFFPAYTTYDTEVLYTIDTGYGDIPVYHNVDTFHPEQYIVYFRLEYLARGGQRGYLCGQTAVDKDSYSKVSVGQYVILSSQGFGKSELKVFDKKPLEY